MFYYIYVRYGMDDFWFLTKREIDQIDLGIDHFLGNRSIVIYICR